MTNMWNESALIALGRELKRRGYSFTTVTPATHLRVNRKRAERANDLRGVFGWSRPFDRDLLDLPLLTLAQEAGVLFESSEGLRSSVRWSTCRDDLFVHSAFPTLREDSVFFGPDTLRFASFLERSLKGQPIPARVVDVGCGSGAGGITLIKSIPAFSGELVLADINPKALTCTRVNASIADIRGEVVLSDVLNQVEGTLDLVIANPPYLVDPSERAYRSGGGEHGIDLSLRIVREAAKRLSGGGRLLMYTGTPILDGVDLFRARAAPFLRSLGAEITYEEIDPDVFGEELDEPSYAFAERIAVVSLDARFLQ